MMKWKITACVLVVIAAICVLNLRSSSEKEAHLQLDYATFLGGSDNDRAHGLTVDKTGNLYLVAPVHSNDFPITSDALMKEPTGIYLARIDPEGGLTYSTYLGAPGGANYVHDVAICHEGFVYVVGNTTTSNFPTTDGAFQTAFHGPGDRAHGDAYVMKLSSDCKQVVYSTLIGGSGMDLAGKIAVDADGCAYILGTTSSTDLPVTEGAYDTSFNGGEGDGRDDLFVAKLNPAGSKLLYCTYLGGSKTELQGDNLILDKTGSVLFVGTTASEDFPTTENAYDRDYNGGSGIHGHGDAVVVKLNSTGSKLEYSSFYGGSGDDSARNLAVDSKGLVWIAGSTNSPDFPITKHARQHEIRGGSDGFFAQLDPRDGKLLYASLFGGIGDDSLIIATHASGMIVLTGRTDSPDFPVTTPSRIPEIGNMDTFVSLIDPTTNQLKDSFVMGGSAPEGISAIVCCGDSFYLVGNTASADFPVTDNAWDNTFNGGSNPWGGDALAIKFTLTEM